jgi:hypothetical protein
VTIPDSLKEEHTHLHEVLERVTQEGGALGEAGRVVMEVLHPHFLREEEFAIPPLVMLTLWGDYPVEDVGEIIAMTELLGEEVPGMLEEHATIARTRAVLADRAMEAGKGEYVEFAHDLMHHTKLEEEIMYPASLLVGAYLRQWKVQKERH